MTFNLNLLLCRPRYAYCYQMAEARIMQFQINLALFACQV